MPSLRRLWIAATEAELSAASPPPAPSSADAPWSWRVQGDQAWFASGCGPTAAAAGLSWILSRLHPREIVGIGLAGAYPGAPCPVGRALLLESDRFAELGAEDGAGQFLSLPWPGLETRPFPLHVPAGLSGLPRARGLTVERCTGTARSALARRALGADLESMEGASWAWVADRFGIPFAQIRAVSNVAGVRDRASWRIPEALDALRTALRSTGDSP